MDHFVEGCINENHLKVPIYSDWLAVFHGVKESHFVLCSPINAGDRLIFLVG